MVKMDRNPLLIVDLAIRMKQYITGFLLVIVIGSVFTSCSNDVVLTPSKPKPKALGKMNTIVVLTDQQMWDSAIGDSIRYYYAGEFPVTPRPEPLFDLRYFSTEKILYEEALRELRMYLVIVNLSDPESATTKMLRKDLGDEKFRKAQIDPSYTTSVGKNKWATNQLIIYVFGNTHEEIFQELRQNFGAIATRVKAHDAEQLASLTYAKGDNLGLSKLLKEKYGYTFRIPADFQVAVDEPENNYFDIRKEFDGNTMAITFSKFSYTNTDQLGKAYMKKIMNEQGRLREYSYEANSFMVLNDVDLPILEYAFQKEGSYGKEFRGIWELENDFIGGPYINYMILNESKSEIILVNTWVKAPGKKKRNFLQQLELIVKGS